MAHNELPTDYAETESLCELTKAEMLAISGGLGAEGATEYRVEIFTPPYLVLDLPVPSLTADGSASTSVTA